MANRRLTYLLLAVVVFIVGIASRAIDLHSKLFNKYLGDALYAAMYYLALGIFHPKADAKWRVLFTALFVVSVECFQLTGIPLELRAKGGFAKFFSILLGTVFSWFDMLAYFVGIIAIWLVDTKVGFQVSAEKSSAA